jgi:hypothetical protein
MPLALIWIGSCLPQVSISTIFDLTLLTITSESPFLLVEKLREQLCISRALHQHSVGRECDENSKSRRRPKRCHLTSGKEDLFLAVQR